MTFVHAWRMTSTTEYALADLKTKVAARDTGLDGLHLLSVPLVPEVRLYLAEDSIVWWARMEAEAGMRLETPFWASAWAGGQAVARYVLDHPEVVAGQRVLDVASGSGLVAIAAAMSGAAVTTANDIDAYAIAATMLNAKVNRVSVRSYLGDILDGAGGDADVVLVGDVCYAPAIADRVLGFVERAARRGARVLLGDPNRGHLPPETMEIVASYPAPDEYAFMDAERDWIDVLQPHPASISRLRAD